MKLSFITGNAKKFAEVEKLVPGIKRLDIELDEIQELDSKKIIAHKLQEARKHAKGFIAVEDVSFSMDALGGLPGPLIKWFLQSIGTLGLHQIAEQSKIDRATISAIVGLITPDDKIHYFEGTVPGRVVASRGKTDFGWDSVFQPDGMQETFGELTIEEKNKFSHRAQAWIKLKAFIETL